MSKPTARRHCKSLVNTGFAETEQDGQTTLYKRNSDRVLMSRIRELREKVTRPELLDSIQEMKIEIRRYEDRYDVVSPEELTKQLEAGEPPFWYAPDEDLTPAEVVCHTLLLDSGSRRVSYSMLLIEAEDIDQETLVETARWYDLESTVKALYRPLQDDFDRTDDLPCLSSSQRRTNI